MLTKMHTLNIYVVLRQCNDMEWKWSLAGYFFLKRLSKPLLPRIKSFPNLVTTEMVYQRTFFFLQDFFFIYHKSVLPCSILLDGFHTSMGWTSSYEAWGLKGETVDWQMWSWMKRNILYFIPIWKTAVVLKNSADGHHNLGTQRPL